MIRFAFMFAAVCAAATVFGAADPAKVAAVEKGELSDWF